MAQNDFNPRTDLAVEEREQFTEGDFCIPLLLFRCTFRHRR